MMLDDKNVEEIRSWLSPILVGPMRSTAYAILGYAEWRVGQKEEALKSFEKVLEEGRDIQLVTQARMMIDLIKNGPSDVVPLEKEKPSIKEALKTAPAPSVSSPLEKQNSEKTLPSIEQDKAKSSSQ